MCIMALAAPLAGALGAGGGAAAAGAAAATGAATAGFSGMQFLQIGLGVMGAISSYQAQMAQYREQVRFRNEQAKQAQKTLNQTVAQQQTQRESQLNKAQQEGFKAARIGMVKKAQASAAAAESGAFGLSTAHLLSDYDRQVGEFGAELNYNSDVQYKDTKNQLRMAERGAQARLASIPIPTKPSFLPTMIEIGGSILGGLGSSGTRGTPGHTLVGPRITG